uniref:UDP-N-acetylmuramoyl-tripeptide--D-alanyl-D- alanine ligase n=1 Tax=Flavobacterium sp. TaxID=239 RepID=UPI00404A9C70
MIVDDLYKIYIQCSNVVIDTRKIIEGSFFIAIKGERFDANQFASEALKLGAKFVLIDNENYYIDDRTGLVDNCLEALQSLAKHHRQELKTPVIALTGSNGKTTTKELINCVLSQKYNTLATIGNLNNHIGVPLTLLRLKKEHEFAIIEMGANHQKEINFLCELAAPDFGYVTNFGKAHLEGFGGVEGVIKGKSEMYDYLKVNNKKIFINADDTKQMERAFNGDLITFSTLDEGAMFKFSVPNANPLVEFSFQNVLFSSQLTGLYNSTNIMVAVAIGYYFKIDLQSIKIAVNEYYPDNNRSQFTNIKTNKILLDAYNANPSSMIAAVEHFINNYKDNTLLILGDMFELGEETIKEHQYLVDYVLKNDVKCFFIGKAFYKCKLEANNLNFYDDFIDFTKFLSNSKIENASILIKGSRGMALERVLDYL